MRRLVMLLATFGAAAQAQTTPTSPEEFAARAGTVINCTIKPLREVEVATPIEGTVSSVEVAPGDQVEVDDTLIRLNTDLARAELRVAEARATATSDLEAARARRDGLAARVARLATAFERQAVSAADYESAQLDLTVAENDIAREQERLDLARIEAERAALRVEKSVVRSTVAGVVGEDLIDPGESTVNTPVATIYVNQPLRVEAFAPAAILVDFVEKESHSIVVNDRYDAPLEVDFDYAAPVADLASNTISVFFKLDAPSVLPGSNCVIPFSGHVEN